jgi:hypothetical protein
VVSQRSRGWPTEPLDAGRRGRASALQPSPDDADSDLVEWPQELRRCTCSTMSFEPADHAIGCALGARPPNSSQSGIGW